MVEDAYLAKLYSFLQENHRWNKDFQWQVYRQRLATAKTPFDKLKALLHHDVNSQSKPRLNKLCEFWKCLEKFQANRKTCISFLDFDNYLATSSTKYISSLPGTWSHFFDCLESQPGWGQKTAALFIKDVIKIHLSQDKSLQFFCDFPPLPTSKDKSTDDRIYLPVDGVIKKIFEQFGNYNDFDKINCLLHANYSGKDMLLWDDLWFWGFITQQIIEGERELKWNEAKYWSLEFTPKDDASVEKVTGKAKKFIDLCKHPSSNT